MRDLAKQRLPNGHSINASIVIKFSYHARYGYKDSAILSDSAHLIDFEGTVIFNCVSQRMLNHHGCLESSLQRRVCRWIHLTAFLSWLFASLLFLSEENVFKELQLASLTGVFARETSLPRSTLGPLMLANGTMNKPRKHGPFWTSRGKNERAARRAGRVRENPRWNSVPPIHSAGEQENFIAVWSCDVCAKGEKLDDTFYVSL